MKTSYNPATDSLYIHLADHASADSVVLADGLVVDYDLDGVAVAGLYEVFIQSSEGVDTRRGDDGVCVRGFACAVGAGEDDDAG